MLATAREWVSPSILVAQRRNTQNFQQPAASHHTGFTNRLAIVLRFQLSQFLSVLFNSAAKVVQHTTSIAGADPGPLYLQGRGVRRPQLYRCRPVCFSDFRERFAG